MEQTAKRNPGGQPRRFKSAADLQAAIDSYWLWLEEKGRTVTLNRRGDTADVAYPAYWPRLLLHIGMPDSTATPYINGEYDDEDNNYSEVLSRARATVEALTAEGALRGEINDRMAQLIMGYHHGVLQRSEQIVSGTVIHQLDPASLVAAEDRLMAARQARLSAPDTVITVDCEPVS